MSEQVEEIRPLTPEEIHEQQIIALFGAMDDFEAVLRHTRNRQDAADAARHIGSLALDVLAARMEAGTLLGPESVVPEPLVVVPETTAPEPVADEESEDEAVLESLLTRVLAKLGWRGHK